MADLNFDQYLAEDTPYQAALAAIGEREKADRAVLNATGQSLVIPYGEVPGFPQGGTPFGIGDPQGMSQQDIWNQMFDPETARLAGLATQSGVSTVAQSQHGRDVNYANMIGALAGRGQIRSGAFGTHAFDVDRSFQAQRYSDLQTLLRALGVDWNDYLSSEATRRQERSDATNAALSRIIAKIQAGLIGGKTPDPNKPAAPTTDPYPVPPGPFPVDPNTGELITPIRPGGGLGGLGGGDSGSPFLRDNPSDAGGGDFIPPLVAVDLRPSSGLGGLGGGDGGFLRDNPSDAGGGDFIPGPSIPSIPDIPQPDYSDYSVPDYSNNYFETNQSPDIPQYAAPRPAGYGGTATSGQVSRNNY
jgi:hypothetical protein